ncbi:MAG: hypothetical protein A2V70_09915 [Planctomycetes bacterium RBG_13_63_9]|nr:MAG: hypothetical protein A2V70_09915 [Planctomycetes bacterium RBG_13_63_9]
MTTSPESSREMLALQESWQYSKIDRRNRMPRKSQLTHFPDTKISETFLHFAEPLLVSLGPDATNHQMEQVLKVAFTVWNAVVYETANGETRFLDMLRESISPEPEMAVAIEQLIVRKRSLFGEDHRVVGQYKLTRKDGELRLWAEARNPMPSN